MEKATFLEELGQNLIPKLLKVIKTLHRKNGLHAILNKKSEKWE